MSKSVAFFTLRKKSGGPVDKDYKWLRVADTCLSSMMTAVENNQNHVIAEVVIPDRASSDLYDERTYEDAFLKTKVELPSDEALSAWREFILIEFGINYGEYRVTVSHGAHGAELRSEIEESGVGYILEGLENNTLDGLRLHVARLESNWPSKITTWHRLVNAGVNPRVALVAACSVSVIGKTIIGKQNRGTDRNYPFSHTGAALVAQRLCLAAEGGFIKRCHRDGFGIRSSSGALPDSKDGSGSMFWFKVIGQGAISRYSDVHFDGYSQLTCTFEEFADKLRKLTCQE